MIIFNDEFRAIIKKIDDYTIIVNDEIYFIFHMIINIFCSLFEVLLDMDMKEERAGVVLLVYACSEMHKEKL